jgi:O-methyltransferase involved in polyketide biosynthesis
MDSRICRVGHRGHLWYDLDFPDVIAQRKKHYEETERYHMIASDVREHAWIDTLPGTTAIVVMEGISMYLRREELCRLLAALNAQFKELHILMDCYTEFAAKASRVKNPINDVGVTQVYGLDHPEALEENTGLQFVAEHSMTPDELTAELKGTERRIFRTLYGGSISKKMYRLYEFASGQEMKNNIGALTN